MRRGMTTPRRVLWRAAIPSRGVPSLSTHSRSLVTVFSAVVMTVSLRAFSAVVMTVSLRVFSAVVMTVSLRVFLL